MDRNDENREKLRRSEGDGGSERSDVGGAGSQSSTDRTPDDRGAGGGNSGSGEKGTIDKLIDKAQEKGIFEKAEKFVKDKFGGGGSSRRR